MRHPPAQLAPEAVGHPAVDRPLHRARLLRLVHRLVDPGPRRAGRTSRATSFVLSGELGVVDVDVSGRRTTRPAASPPTTSSSAVDISAYDMTRAPEPQQLPRGVCASLKDGVEVLVGRAGRGSRRGRPRRGAHGVRSRSDRGDDPRGPRDRRSGASAPRRSQVRGPASVVEPGRPGRRVRRASPRPGSTSTSRWTADPVDIARPAGRRRPARGRPRGRCPSRSRSAPSRPRRRSPVRPNIESGTPAPGFALEAISGRAGVRDDRRAAGGARRDHVA